MKNTDVWIRLDEFINISDIRTKLESQIIKNSGILQVWFKQVSLYSGHVIWLCDIVTVKIGMQIFQFAVFVLNHLPGTSKIGFRQEKIMKEFV